MMRRMGITEEQDKEWHRDNKTLGDRNRTMESVNPFIVGGGFIDYCVGKGWMKREGKGRSAKYYLTEKGREEIGKYGIKL